MGISSRLAVRNEGAGTVFCYQMCFCNARFTHQQLMKRNVNVQNDVEFALVCLMPSAHIS